ncbi:MAG: DUF3307 domain-containing protein [Balneolaceae bacterium]|nr:DUF3307 domain-containing protein [Balneolaceae bacterium]
MNLILKLLLAHLIGDYALQPKSWVQAKEVQKLKAPQLYIHVLLHGVLTFMLLFSEGPQVYLPATITILITHWLIDVVKLQFQGQGQKSRQRWFIGDQAAHVLVIGAIWYYFNGGPVMWESLFTEQLLLVVVCIVFLTQPAAICIMVLISGWSPEEEDDEHSLENAGRYIGMLERLFVFGFIVTGNWQGIGFLLAAKSVFRFGDLRKAKDRNLTEYILIGTLLSFGIAIVTGLTYLALAQG